MTTVRSEKGNIGFSVEQVLIAAAEAALKDLTIKYFNT